MSISFSSDSDRDEEDREILNRILAKSGKSPSQIPNDVDSDSDSSSGSDVQDWFRQLQEKFSLTSADADCTPMPLNVRVPVSDSDDDDENVAEMMAAIHRRFDRYQNDALKEQSRLQEGGMAVTGIESGTERTDASSINLKLLDQLPDTGFNDSHQSVDESCNLSVKALTYSQFPKSAQNFVDALKKNRSCQRFIRKKLMEIEAKIEENKKLKERIKCLMDFQLACKRKVGHILCQKKDPRVRLISVQKPRRKSKATKHCTKFPALYFGPTENSHVSKYKMVMKRFPVSFKKQLWSNAEKENLAKGLTQQYQEMLLLNSMNLESDSEGSMNTDLFSALLNNDLEVTPERIRSFLPSVNWDRLASMYLSGRSGAECESRWLNCDDPLINHSPWTVLEDKKLLFIVQERGIYNWMDIALMLGTQRTPFQCLARYQRSLNPHILNKEWTEDEDARLRTAMEIFGDSNWQLVASHVGGRTGPQCSNRWRKTLNPERRKVGRWSVDEDKRLKVAVMLFGAKNWNKIAQFAPGRTQVQCRERWLNCLDPSLKLEAWTEEEDDKLLAAIDEHGYCWSKVATCVPPRTDNQCMRRWKILLPHEVPLLRAARRMKRTVLISNFVDRESERPAIGPSDFSSLGNHPASEFGNDRRTSKRRSRDGIRKENQREASAASRDKKIKKSKAKSRTSPQEHVTETGDQGLVPAGTGVSTNTGKVFQSGRAMKKSKGKYRMSSEENVTETGDFSLVLAGTDASTDIGEIGCTKRRRKRGPRDQKTKMSKAKSRMSYEENVTDTGDRSLVLVGAETGDLNLVPVGTETGALGLVPAGTGARTDTGATGSIKRRRRRRGPSDQKIKKSKAKFRMFSGENSTETGDLNLVPARTETGDLSFVPAGTETGDLNIVPMTPEAGDLNLVPATPEAGDLSLVPATPEAGDLSLVPATPGAGDMSLVPATVDAGDMSLAPAGTGARTDTGHIGSTKRRRERGPRRPSKSNVVKGSSGTAYTVDIFADEDVPLKSWLESLVLEARRKRAANKSSRSLAGIYQKNTYRGVAEAIPSLNPGAKRKRSSREPGKKAASRRENNSFSVESRNLISRKKDMYTQSTGDAADAVTSLLGFASQQKAEEKQRLDGGTTTQL